MKGRLHAEVYSKSFSPSGMMQAEQGIKKLLQDFYNQITSIVLSQGRINQDYDLAGQAHRRHS